LVGRLWPTYAAQEAGGVFDVIGEVEARVAMMIGDEDVEEETSADKVARGKGS
jgi:hypothetical protein